MEHSCYNYKMVVSYDGTAYAGWQVQPNALTIQEVIQKKLAIILRHEVLLIGSGRTDAGVHAVGQTAHFHLNREIDLYRLLGSINGLLPPDIRVQSIEPAAPSFHAQYSATGKCYHYCLHIGKVQNPFRRLYSLHVKEQISVDALREGSSLFLGTHDFTSFANEPHRGTAAHDPVRTIRRLDLIEEEEELRLEIEADGFLYKMVRNIVGTLLEVASGHRALKEIAQIFLAKDRKQAGKAAPPHGLLLYKVHYEL
jgi:tRNA pseudouridine38-40 synthase